MANEHRRSGEVSQVLKISVKVVKKSSDGSCAETPFIDADWRFRLIK